MVSIRNQWYDAQDGVVQIWEQPRDGAEYTIGIDCAGGGAAGDPAASVVIENDTCALVAVARARMDPTPWAEQNVMLGEHYNTALLAFETHPSNFGLAACLKAIELEYSNLYRAVRIQSLTPDASMNLGWKTDSTTKPLLIERVKTALRDRYAMQCEDLCRELGLRQWIGDEAKDHADRFKFGGKGHDDLVIAWGIALCVRDQTWIKPVNYLPKDAPRTDSERIWQMHEDEMAQYSQGASAQQRRRDYAWI